MAIKIHKDRRYRPSLMTVAELAINNAILKVENLKTYSNREHHIKINDAVASLRDAQDSIADYVDNELIGYIQEEK